MTIEGTIREADTLADSAPETNSHKGAAPQTWLWGVAAFSVAVVAGALTLIATRSDLLALDLGPHIARWLWCF